MTGSGGSSPDAIRRKPADDDHRRSPLVGAVLGLVVAYNVIDDASRQSSWTGISMAVPWVTLAVIFVTVYVVSVATAFIPARTASRVEPASALRYQ